MEKRVKKFGQGSPPPLFGQCPKENIFFTGWLPLAIMIVEIGYMMPIIHTPRPPFLISSCKKSQRKLTSQLLRAELIQSVACVITFLVVLHRAPVPLSLPLNPNNIGDGGEHLGHKVPQDPGRFPPAPQSWQSDQQM